MKRIKDFTPYINILPYSSEIFGVYQPLLGWRSKRIEKRIVDGYRNDKHRLFRILRSNFRGNFQASTNEDGSLKKIESVKPASFQAAFQVPTSSYILESIIKKMPPSSAYRDEIWNDLIQKEKLQETLDTVVVPKCMEWYKESKEPSKRKGSDLKNSNQMIAEQLNKESSLAGYLIHLKENQHYDVLKELFYKYVYSDDNSSNIKTSLPKLALMKYSDPLELFDPFKDIDRVGLSPIGIVHLFREYFFELDSFLGPPVSHVWLSPGATVELIEISTRKTIVEKTLETTLETILKTEKSTTEEDELSDAVKDSNQSDTKFGMNANVEQGWIGGSASASANFSMGTTQNKARETTHKHMRQQTEKLSTEIRKNYKSTFKTITETTDTSSKRYVLANSTPELINYELRRKFRQVAVQVQDIGTYLCWQTYVDDPGKQLGISKLVHIAKTPEVQDAPDSDSIPMPQNISTEIAITIPFSPATEDTVPEDDMDEVYKDLGNSAGGFPYAEEINKDTNEGADEKIYIDFGPFGGSCEQPGYQLSDIQFDYKGNHVILSLRTVDGKELKDNDFSPLEVAQGKIKFHVHVNEIDFKNVDPMVVAAKVIWEPTKVLIDQITEKNTQKVTEFKEKRKYEYQKAFVDAARERIEKASNIKTRLFEELREEERIVVYRKLIQEMLTNKIGMPDERTHHVVSELLNTIFDVDKMLYFVAPEWWQPRLHRSHQGLGGIHKIDSTASPPSPGNLHDVLEGVKNQIFFTPQLFFTEDKQIATTDIVSWGGINEGRRDNYYITENSEPAKFGSSLGWLLQLDGDNLRNAFLNAPWVKAVIPIRPGKEKAAMNWLQRVGVEGTNGLEDQYIASPEELAEIPHTGQYVTIKDAINHLCELVAKKHEDSLKVDKYPKDEINDDNKVDATPIDRVYEHGFYPLQGGFRANVGQDQFDVFDQWIEILPTDQVVPVEVRYDPKTGRQI